MSPKMDVIQICGFLTRNCVIRVYKKFTPLPIMGSRIYWFVALVRFY